MVTLLSLILLYLDLIANGVNNVHIYAMNKPDVAAKIMENISYIRK